MTVHERSTSPAHPHAALPPWVGDLIAVVVVVAIAFVPFQGHVYRPGSSLAVLVVVAPAVVLPLRRRAPVLVLAVVIGLFGIAALTGTLSPGIVIATAIAMFAVANRRSRKASLVIATCSVALIVLLSLLAAVGSIFDPRTVQFAVTVAFAAAAGDAARSRREYIVAVTDRAERAEQTRESEARRRVTEERLRIARDLHDAVAHQISVISLNAGVASSALESRPEKAREALSTIRSSARTVLGEIGDLLEVLRSDEPGDSSALPQPGLDRLQDLVSTFDDAGLRVTVRVEGDLGLVTGAADLVAYRVVQEALTNAHKHGGDHRAHVLITAEPDHALIVVTNPVPIPGNTSVPPHERRSGHGLLGLRERVASVRGTVTIGTTPGGYRVAADIPLSKEHL